MFYCDACGKERNWPTGWADSYGSCEICGKTATCNDVKSKNLPNPKEELEEHL